MPITYIPPPDNSQFYNALQHSLDIMRVQKKEEEIRKEREKERMIDMFTRLSAMNPEVAAGILESQGGPLSELLGPDIVKQMKANITTPTTPEGKPGAPMFRPYTTAERTALESQQVELATQKKQLERSQAEEARATQKQAEDTLTYWRTPSGEKLTPQQLSAGGTAPKNARFATQEEMLTEKLEAAYRAKGDSPEYARINAQKALADATITQAVAPITTLENARKAGRLADLQAQLLERKLNEPPPPPKTPGAPSPSSQRLAAQEVRAVLDTFDKTRLGLLNLVSDNWGFWNYEEAEAKTVLDRLDQLIAEETGTADVATAEKVVTKLEKEMLKGSRLTSAKGQKRVLVPEAGKAPTSTVIPVEYTREQLLADVTKSLRARQQIVPAFIHLFQTDPLSALTMAQNDPAVLPALKAASPELYTQIVAEMSRAKLEAERTKLPPGAEALVKTSERVRAQMGQLGTRLGIGTEPNALADVPAPPEDEAILEDLNGPGAVYNPDTGEYEE